MSKIAVLITDMFEDEEYSRPAKSFMDAGHNLIHVGINKGQIVKGKRYQTPVKIDETIKDVSVSDFDALFIPGGYSPDKLRVYDEVVNFTKEFVLSNKPVLLICHAPQILITADILKGRKVTGYKSIIQDIKNAGASYLDQEVVLDENLVSSRNPSDIEAFSKASLEKLKS